MKISEIRTINNSEIDKWLKVTDLENIFNLYLNKDGDYIYNMNSTMYLNIPENYFKEFVCTNNMSWPLISYKLYGTTRLAWFLLKINNIKNTDIYKICLASTKVKYIDKNTVSQLLDKINDTGITLY